jgi:alpha-methylacyl-CoA racemase
MIPLGGVMRHELTDGLRERATYVEIDGVLQPAPAPRFSRSVPPTPQPARPWASEEAEEILGPWLDQTEVLAARNAGTID